MYPMLPPEEERGPAYQPTTEEQRQDAIYEYAAQLLEQKMAPSEVRQKLLEHGVDPKSTGIIVDEMLLARSRGLFYSRHKNALAAAGGGNTNKAASRNMAIGVLVFGMGLVALFVSIGGGRVAFPFGAILGGALLFLFGLSQRDR